MGVGGCYRKGPLKLMPELRLQGYLGVHQEETEGEGAEEFQALPIPVSY